MATQMLENGSDLRWIQAMLGHASVESTQIYTQVSVRALQAVHTSTHPAERDNEEQIRQAFSRHDAGEGEYINNTEIEKHMNALKCQVQRDGKPKS